jgi:hypothetical protein
MGFDLVLSEPKGKDSGENILLGNLPIDYKVYLFYYSGVAKNKELEDLADHLREFGEISGKNLFVNIGELDDPQYNLISEKFNIRSFPVIIITAKDQLASSIDFPYTAYIRIDGKRISDSAISTLELVQQLFNLFIQKKICEAMKQNRRDRILYHTKKLILGVSSKLKVFIKEEDISISLLVSRQLCNVG